MKRWLSALTLFLLVLPLSAQQTAKEAEKPVGGSLEVQKELMPPEMYAILGQLAGTWRADLKVLLNGSPPRETRMTDKLEAKWILGEKFLESHFNNGFVEGKIIMGYNGVTREFFRYLMDTVDPRGIFSRGVYVRSKNALVFRGEENNPVSRDTFIKRDVFTFGPDKDKFHYEQFYGFADGSEIKVIEGYYTRVSPTLPDVP